MEFQEAARRELIEALRLAKLKGLKISVEGMDSDRAANHVIDVLIQEGCLKTSQPCSFSVEV